MIFAQFQASADPFGNLLIAGGWVMQPRMGVALPVVGLGGGALASQAAADGNLWPALPVQGRAFVGGSGNTVIVSSPPGGPADFDGIYLALSATLYVNTSGPGELRISGGNATLWDQAAAVTGPSSGWPTGGFMASTTYGEDMYHGSGFTLGITSEPSGNGMPDLTVAIPTGLSEGFVITLPGPDWTVVPGVPQLWTLAGLAAGSWEWGAVTILIAADGTAGLYYSATLYATRAAGSLTDPSGIYTATTAGKNAWHDGNAWQAYVTGGRVAPRAGWAYLQIEDVAGVLTSVAGPFFATSLPTHSGDLYYYPLAYCSGTAAPEQVHLGPVQWGHTTGTNGTDGTGLPWIVLTEAAYDALGTPDPDTIYDVTP